MTTINIDYLQCSISYREENCFEQKHKQITPLAFYRRGYQDALGVRRYFGNPNTNKALIVYGGSALSNHRVVGWSNEETIEDLLTKGAKISRLDIAITDDEIDQLVKPCDITEMFTDGSISGTLCKYGCKTITSHETGAPAHIETTYIGDLKKRGTLGIFRAYDKGLESDLARDILTRIELEERGTNAHNSAKRIVKGAKLNSVMKTRIQFADKRMSRFFECEDIPIQRGDSLETVTLEDEMNKKWEWLLKTVSPTLRKAVEYDRKSGLGDERLLQFLERACIIERIE